MTWLDSLADKALARELPTRDEALKVLTSSDDELMDVVAAAFRVRLRYFGRRVKLNYLVSIKSGLCPEDCFYCSQRLGSAADVLKYTWLKPGEVLQSAEAGVKAGAKRVCLVASGRGPSDKDVARVSGMIAAFKTENPDVEVCACLGLLSDGQAERLQQAGTTAYNHNLNTAESNYGDICSTHSFQDRADTVSKAKQGGLSPCSGLIAGMGETDEQLADVAFALRELDPDSVPVNFLTPCEGTPLGGQWTLTPQRGALERDQEVDRHRVRVKLAQRERHVGQLLVGLAHPGDQAGARRQAALSGLADGVGPVLERVRAADVTVVAFRGVQVVVVGGRAGLLQAFGLAVGEQAQAGADLDVGGFCFERRDHTGHPGDVLIARAAAAGHQADPLGPGLDARLRALQHLAGLEPGVLEHVGRRAEPLRAVEAVLGAQAALDADQVVELDPAAEVPQPDPERRRHHVHQLIV